MHTRMHTYACIHLQYTHPHTPTHTLRCANITSFLHTERDIRTPPKVTEQPEDQTNVTVSSMVTLFCNFSGIPAPTVRWFKDDQDTGVEGQYFIIGVIRPEDRGAYHCVAENELANGVGRAVSQKATVLIQGTLQCSCTAYQVK